MKLIDDAKNVFWGSAANRLALGAAAATAIEGAVSYWMSGQPLWRCGVYVTILLAIPVFRIIYQSKLHTEATPA